MSGRALRKLQKQQEEAKLSNQIKNQVDEADDYVEAPQQKTGNAFAMLLDDDDDAAPSNDEDGLGVDEQVIEKQDANPASVYGPKKKRKKKKKASKQDEQVEEEDEFDRAIREVNEKLGALPADPIDGKAAEDGENGVHQAALQRLEKLLSVHVANLDWESEMQKNFGRDAVNAALGPGGANGGKRKKRSVLVNPKSTWPKSAGASGLGMEVVDFETSTFTLIHSPAYQTLEMMFYQSVATLNPDTLHAILRENHYHLLTLIQMSEVFKQNGDVSNAADFIERALFSFESSLHAQFNLTNGACRLDFDRIESRPVFIALFRHIQYLARKGCYKSAFEFTKLLFSLDPEDDPLATLLFLDFYCIKAEAYSYFLEFYQSFWRGKGLDHLPNFCYSHAVCQWEFERENKQPPTKSSLLLKAAILSHPEVIRPLFAKLEITNEGFLSHEMFFTPRIRGDNGLSAQVVDILSSFYVESSHVLWKVPELLSWLRSCCKEVVKEVHSGYLFCFLSLTPLSF